MKPELKAALGAKVTEQLGLFEIDQETGRLENEPEVIWSIEVFADVEGGR